MASFWSDNFDGSTSFAAGWTVVAPGATVSVLASTSGTHSAALGTGGNTGSITRSLGANVAQGYVTANIMRRAYAQQVNATVAVTTIGGNGSISLWDATAGAAQVTVTLDASGRGTVRLGGPGGTKIGNSFSMPVDSWHAITVAANIASSGGWLQVAIDDNLVYDYSGNTQSTANAYYSALRLSADAGMASSPDAYIYVDDVAVYSGLPAPLSSTPFPSPLWSDNFDALAAGAPPAAPNWSSIGNTKTFTTQFVSSPNSLGVGTGGNSARNVRGVGALAIGYVDLQYREVGAATNPGGTTTLVLYDATADAAQITVAVSSAGAITAYLGGVSGTVLGTATMSTDAWHHFRVDATIGTSGSLAVTVDGTAVFSFSGNTQATANPWWSWLQLNATGIGPSPAAEAYFDDLAVGGTIPTLPASSWRGAAVQPPTVTAVPFVCIMA